MNPAIGWVMVVVYHLEIGVEVRVGVRVAGSDEK